VVAITVPRADPTWYVRGGAAVERFWLATEKLGWAVQPVSPLFVFAKSEPEMVHLAGERHLDEIFRLSERFNGLLELGDGEAVALLLRVFDAPRPSVRSIRLPLEHLLTRMQDSSKFTEPRREGSASEHRSAPSGVRD
jgi:hypothetical protein